MLGIGRSALSRRRACEGTVRTETAIVSAVWLVMSRGCDIAVLRRMRSGSAMVQRDGMSRDLLLADVTWFD
jgi:predicted Fe-S protein YdhL (DUF1289 family)